MASQGTTAVSTAAAGPHGGRDILAQSKDLQELLEIDAITREEFEQTKAALLERVVQGARGRLHGGGASALRAGVACASEFA